MAKHLNGEAFKMLEKEFKDQGTSSIFIPLHNPKLEKKELIDL